MKKIFSKLLSRLLLGKRFVFISANWKDSTKDATLCIIVVKHVGLDEISNNQSEVFIQTTSYGYDFKEENFINGWYTNAFFNLPQFFKIIISQPFLKWQFSVVDTSKNPEDFYESIKQTNILLSESYGENT